MTDRPGLEQQRASETGIRTVKALVVLDPAGQYDKEPDREFAEIRQIYEEDFHLKLDAVRADVFNPGQADRAEIVIFDWGGASLGNDLMGHQLRALMRWADDHPSALVIIRSALSWSYLQDEIEAKQLPALANVVNDDGRLTLPAWWLSTAEGVKPSRVDKVGLTIHVDPAVRRQLKVLAAERDATVHGLVCEALNLLFAQHSRPEIAE